MIVSSDEPVVSSQRRTGLLAGYRATPVVAELGQIDEHRINPPAFIETANRSLGRSGCSSRRQRTEPPHRNAQNCLKNLIISADEKLGML